MTAGGATGPTRAAAPVSSGPLGPTGNIEVGSPQLQGQLDTAVQDRTIQHYYISEVELAMLEACSGNADRTYMGLALGAAIAFGIVDRTVKNLSPYNHAIFVVGFWAFMFLAVYSGRRAIKAYSLNRKIAADVRKRKTDDSVNEAPAAADQTRRNRAWRWIIGA